MKRNPLFLFLVFSIAFSTLHMACSDDECDSKVPVFTIVEEYLQLDFQQNKSSVSIPVATNLSEEKWSVSSNKDWCVATKDLSSSSAAVKVEVYASEEPEVRSAEITVKSPVRDYTIQVKQLGYGPAILVKEDISVVPDGGPLKISVTSNIEYTISQTPVVNWITEAPTTFALAEKVYVYHVESNYTGQKRQMSFVYTGKQYTEVQAICRVTQESSGVSDVEVEGDFKITPIGGQDSEHQEGQDIKKSYDGKFGGTPYHSILGQAASFPVTLEYFFDGKDIDYMIYHTCNGNGNFGKVDIYIATESAPNYSFYESFDFKMQNMASRIVFAQGLTKVTKIKFSVNSGLGDFVSCDEMEFFKKNPNKQLDAKLLEVFTDITCTQVREDATDEQIKSLPKYFINLAQQLRKGTYDEWEKEFRIQDYDPYSNVEEWAEKLMTKKYGNLDNPTGIYVEPGDSVIILVGNTHEQAISVQCIGEEQSGNYIQTAASGETHFLQEGVNKIGFTEGGMLFIMYNTNLIDANSKPVKIHIPLGSGRVSGFFDVKRHKTNDKYKELIDKATYKYFCVRGEKIMFYFHRDKMLQTVPYDILSAINQWDDIVGWQQELMGIEDVRSSQFNNHLFAISHEGSDMWASDYRIGFTYNNLDKILLKDKLMATVDNIWGPACELGYIHQGAINWAGSTESSKALFANYVLYKLGKYCSRGSELSSLTTASIINKQAWWNLGSGTNQKEDAELHMRMYWQLWNYYHRCGYKPDFWPKLFKLMSEERIEESDPGARQLLFVKNACKAANENLTDFFELWGFFQPVNETIEQQGTWNYRITEIMIMNAKAYIAQFPAPRHVFYYLEDRKNGDEGIGNYNVGDVGYYSQFKDGQRITKTPTYSIAGQRMTIHNGEEAVAFEVRRDNQTLFSSNFLSFDIPASVSLTNTQIAAVQADGRRITLNAAN